MIVHVQKRCVNCWVLGAPAALPHQIIDFRIVDAEKTAHAVTGLQKLSSFGRLVISSFAGPLLDDAQIH